MHFKNSIVCKEIEINKKQEINVANLDTSVGNKSSYQSKLLEDIKKIRIMMIAAIQNTMIAACVL